MAFLLLGPLAPPGFAVIDLQGEIMRQVIDPCFLAAARQKSATNLNVIGGQALRIF